MNVKKIAESVFRERNKAYFKLVENALENKEEQKPKSDRRSYVLGSPKGYLKGGRDYGEYCTDFIEQNALELFLESKFKEFGCLELRQKIEDRNPHTKIFQEGIVKVASKKKKKNYDSEQIIKNVYEYETGKKPSKVNVSQPLMERRDYGLDGKDFIEQQADDLKEEGKLPKDLGRK